MIFDGIPLRFYFSKNGVEEVKVDGEKTAFDSRIIDDKLEVKLYVNSSVSNVELKFNTPVQSKFKIGILETKHNKDRIVPWTTFIEDYIGIKSEVLTNDLHGEEKLKTNNYSLLIAPNVCELSEGILSRMHALIEGGCGVIITNSFPKTDYFILDTEEKLSGDFYLNIMQDHMAIKPYSIKDLIPFQGELTIIKSEKKQVIATIVEGKRIKKEGKITKILRGFLPNYVPKRGYHVEKSSEERVAILSQNIGKGKFVYFTFDPIYTLALDTSQDKGYQGLAKNFNLISIIVSSFIWASSFLVMKGLYKYDKTPFVYSVDVESSVSYYDYLQRKCSFCIEKGCKDEDTKMEHSLNKSAQYLEEFGFIGSFHIDAGGIYDESDENALKKVGKKHDIAFHQGPSGSHKLWAENILNDEWIEKDLTNGRKKIEKILGYKIRGMRYPAMMRNSKTHDILGQNDLLYDSSSLAWYPYGTIPIRMFSNKGFKPLGLWEIPLFEVINVVKNKPKSFRSKLKVRYEISKILEYIKKCHLNNGMICLLDHDMSIGSNLDHMHGKWHFNKDGFEHMMKLITKSNIFRKFWITKSSEFIEWYSTARKINIEADLPIINVVRIKLSLRGSY